METLDPSVRRHLVAKPKQECVTDIQSVIWIEDDQLGYRLCTILDEGLSDVLVGFRDEQGFFEKKRVEKKNYELPSLNTSNDDLCTLTQPNAATVLDSLTYRYTNGVIHTYCGLFCVVLNPWKNIPIYTDDVKSMYSGATSLPPHVYSVAQNAFHGMLRGGNNQSILITGESGAGKTENTKKIIDFILSSCSQDQKNTIGECVVTSAAILEAFGNAKTLHNNNSSRFGKFIRIEFDEDAHVIGAKIECYLLEKSRVVNQCEGDRNFHIFYQMLSDYFDVPHKKFLKLSRGADGYKFLKTSPGDNINDSSAAKSTDEAFSKIGITEEEKRLIFQILSAIIWIGNIKFGERAGRDMSFVESDTEVNIVAELLEIKNSKLVDSLTQPTIKVHDKLIRKNQNLAKTLSSAYAMAKVLYERVFGLIVQKCNDAFGNCDNSDEVGKFIAVLDIAGFEIVQNNSFEQFCINYTNEKLQQFFNHYMFVKEQTDYLEEGLNWTQSNYSSHLQPTIDLIEKPMGMLSLLEEECLVPSGSDKSLLEKYCATLTTYPSFLKAKQSQKNTMVRHFSIKHYAGEVHYTIDGWVDKNRDNVETSVLELLSTSTHPILKTLFPTVSTNVTKNRRGTIIHSTVTFTYKNQLQSLLEALHSSSAHFIRCVVPNYARVPGKVEPNLILNQLRCNGVLEGIRICREGYPSRIPHKEFFDRYKLLCSSHQDFPTRDIKEDCRRICIAAHVQSARFAVGKTKLFSKVGVITELEQKRKETISKFIVKLQSHIRSYHAEKKHVELQRKLEATFIIQENVRVFADLSQWPWFRIYQLSRALIPKNRDKERIAELEKILEEKEDELAYYEEQQEEASNAISELTSRLDAERMRTAEAQKEAREAGLKAMEQIREKEKKMRQTLNEMQQNEDLFGVLEKKYNEQHLKVKKMNDILREYERKIDQFDMQKADIEAENARLRENLQRETCQWENLQKEALEKTSLVDGLQAQIQKLHEENQQLKLQIAKLENLLEDEKARTQRQNSTIQDLQKLVTELNEKIARLDGLTLNEKNSTRKAEREKEKIADELTQAKEFLQRQAKKMDQLRDELRKKDSEVRKLEKKLEDKEAVMSDVMKDLKDSHKERVKELERKMEEVKRKNSKLEHENSSQKNEIETFQRESSVDSDYGRSSSGRLSNIGRQYSLTSMGSFSSIRTVGLTRKDSISDMTSSMYSLGRRSSLYDMTSSVSGMPPPPLQRCPSTSNMMEKEKKIMELEREKGQINTDLQLVRRELDVYKSQLAAEKESLQQTVRKLQSQIQDSTRGQNSAEKNSDNLNLRLKKALADVEVWKKKFEDSVQESKDEVLAERKRAQERNEASERESVLKQARLSTAENAKTELQIEVARGQAELDRARAIIAELENNIKAQETLGGSFEIQQKTMNFEMESLRDENCALKAKIRRQFRQIELLTQQDDTSGELDHFQNKLDRMDSKV